MDRPTVGHVRALQEELAARTQGEADLFARLQVAEFERDSWRAERLEVPEAEALARCIRALDQYVTTTRAPLVSIGAAITTATGGTPTTPKVAADGIERILDYLEARYCPLDGDTPAIDFMTRGIAGSGCT